MKLILTPKQAYERKQRIWRAYCRWAESVRRAFFPDTGGVSLYMHNWYRCAEKTNHEGAKLADWIEESTYARVKRLEAAIEARDCEREHLRHSAIKGFDPLWCPICHPERKRV
jgi:hypothetical protein